MKPGPLYLRTAAKPGATRVTPKGLPTHVKLRIGGKPRSVPVAYFDKPAISVGRYVHSLTGQRFKVTPKRIDRWVSKFNRMKRAGVDVPTPVDHSDAAEDNRGFVVDARREGKTLVLTHQAIGKDAAKLALRNRCSVLIDPDFRDGSGKRWGDVIAHSAYTPKPVIHGHGSFMPIAASRSGGTRKVPVFIKLSQSDDSQEEQAMPVTVKAAVSALSVKQRDRLRKVLKLKPSVKIKADVLIGQMLAAGTDRAAKAMGILNSVKVDKSAKKVKAKVDDDDDVDDEEDEDSEDDDEEDDTDVDDELEDDEDEDSEDEDEDDVDDAEEDDEAKATSTRRQKVAASRAGRPDRHTVLLMSRALRVERENAIRKGGITPAVADYLDRILLRKGKPNELALSAVPGARDPLAFMLYRALGRNKPVPMREKSGSQARMALGRIAPGSSKKDREERKELRRLEKETKEWAARQGGNRSAKTA